MDVFGGVPPCITVLQTQMTVSNFNNHLYEETHAVENSVEFIESSVFRK
jgi:hypothetical protein